MEQAPERVIARIEARIDKSTDCWTWTGPTVSGGYGRVTWSVAPGKLIWRSTHRVMYRHLVGDIPEGLDLDHLCRNRACCNPEHLEPVTRQVNLLRGDTIPARRAAVTECPAGHPYEGENLMIDTLGRRGCRECVRAKNRAYYHANKERRAQYNREWRARRSVER